MLGLKVSTFMNLWMPSDFFSESICNVRVEYLSSSQTLCIPPISNALYLESFLNDSSDSAAIRGTALVCRRQPVQLHCGGRLQITVV